MGKLIDADKLLEWMTFNAESDGFWKGETIAVNKAYENLQKAINSGSMDPDPIPLPTIKPGDKVRHEERGEGVVKEVYGDEIIADYGDVRIGCNKSKLEVSHE